MTLSTDERRALALIAALLILASGARWLERPRELLADTPRLDLAALEEASRAEAAGTGSKPAKRIANPPERTPAAARGQGSRTEARIDPNTATAAELDRIPGVGPALAARIVEERERAPFRSLRDLERVHGIGAALAKRMALHVTLPDVPARAAKAADPLPTPVQRGSSGPGNDGPAAPFDLNEIGASDLQKVSGIGPVLAARIVARREVAGRFRSWAQVDSVAGVGPALLARLQESAVLRR